MINPDDEIAEAWGRLLNDCARVGDGEKALIWLRRLMFEVLPLGAETCAVHEHNGSRRLAATLINLAVISEHVRTERSDQSDARTDAEFQQRRARYAAESGSSRARGAARRVPERLGD